MDAKIIPITQADAQTIPKLTREMLRANARCLLPVIQKWKDEKMAIQEKPEKQAS